MRVFINGLYYTIDFVDRIEHDNSLCDGLVKYDETAIFIKDSLSHQRKQEVTLHEIMHALLHDSALDNLNSETYNELLTHDFLSFIKTNRDILNSCYGEWNITKFYFNGLSYMIQYGLKNEIDLENHVLTIENGCTEYKLNNLFVLLAKFMLDENDLEYEEDDDKLFGKKLLQLIMTNREIFNFIQEE